MKQVYTIMHGQKNIKKATICLFLGPVMYKHSLCQLDDDKTHYSLK